MNTTWMRSAGATLLVDLSGTLAPGRLNGSSTETLTVGAAAQFEGCGVDCFTLESTADGAVPASELIANSVGLSAGAEFSYTGISASPLTLTIGAATTALFTNKADALSGTFANLANIQDAQIGRNWFQAVYSADSLTLRKRFHLAPCLPMGIGWGNTWSTRDESRRGVPERGAAAAIFYRRITCLFLVSVA